MALADRIAVLDHGRVLQMAAPATLYREPADVMVAGFIGDGMVVPANVIAANGGSCAAEVFGHRAELRCSPKQDATTSRACLRAGDLSIARSGEDGIAVQLERAIYKGGCYRLETRVDQAPETTLHLSVPEPLRHEIGAAIRLAVHDGWVIPASA
jgi:iron(III) transport system ATP-binding protein